MKGNGKSFLLIIIMAVIMTASLVGGYVAITHFSPAVKEKFDVYTDPVLESLRQGNSEESVQEPFSYKGTDRSDYIGPRICESEGYLINSDGKVVSDYRNEIGSSLRITMDKDASQAVFTNLDMGYYVDADLNVTMFTNHTRLAGMSFDGDYYFYVWDGDYNNKLYLHDIENETEQLMAEGRFKSVCISPNGRTLVYTLYGDRENIHVVGLDLPKEKVFEAEDDCTPVTVSDDGETVFYYVYKDDRVYYCLDHGKDRKIGKKKYGECYLDRECKQFLYSDKRGRIKYFRAGEKKPVTVCGSKDSRMLVNSGCAVSQDLYMDEYVIDADSFSDAIMIKTDKKCYALEGDTPKTVDMIKEADHVYFVETYVSGGGPMCIYNHAGTIYKAVYDGYSVNTTVLYEAENYSMDYVCSTDLSKLWIRDGRAIYYLEEGADRVLLKEYESEGSYLSVELAYDPLEDLCYYILYGTLYCVGDNAESTIAVSDKCSRFGYVFDEPKLVTVRDVGDTAFIVVKKEMLIK